MKILAIEFSSEQRSVALVEKNSGAGCHIHGSVSDSTRQAAALSLVEKVLADSKTEREQIEVIAIGLGPGSYNGIRAAIALAQGWQLASGKIKLLGVSSAECLARVAQGKNHFGKVRVVIDAQRNEVYSAVYEISAREIRVMTALRIAGVEDVQAAVQNGETVVGPEVKRWIGTGIEMSPEAAMLGKIAAQRSDFVHGESLEPIYLRETSFVKAPPPRVV